MSGRRRLARGAPVLGALAFGAAVLSCILPDYDIQIEDEQIANRNPVRFAESLVLSDAADLACDPKPDDEVAVSCPQPSFDPRDDLPHFLDPSYVDPDDDLKKPPWYFCTCPQGQFDDRAFAYTLYVEDQDEVPRTRDPRDDIYAALFLDLPPKTDEPLKYTDYEDNLDNKVRLDFVDEDTPYKPLYRRDPHLRQLFLGVIDNRLDLCNGGRAPLAPGLHTLTVMVTDRFWFKDEQGIAHVGTPDIASGAAFDTITYVFSCANGADNPEQCACEDEDEADEGAF